MLGSPDGISPTTATPSIGEVEGPGHGDRGDDDDQRRRQPRQEEASGDERAKGDRADEHGRPAHVRELPTASATCPIGSDASMSMPRSFPSCPQTSTIATPWM